MKQRRALDFDDQFPALLRLAHRVARRILGDHADAEGVATEVLARAYVRWDRISAYPEPWVVRVTTNLAIDQARRGPPPSSTVETAASPEVLVAQRMIISDALKRLPKRQREVVVLTLLCDFSQAEVAEKLQISIGSVKQHASRGAESLRRHLGEPTDTKENPTWTSISG